MPNEANIARTKQHKIQTVDLLDPKKLFGPCFHINYELDFCFVSGKSSFVNCGSIAADKEFPDRTQEFISKALSSSSNKMIFFLSSVKKTPQKCGHKREGREGKD